MMTETLPIDSIMIDRWKHQWLKQFGFNNDQLIKRNTKVEQFSKLVLDRLQTKQLMDIAKREQLLIETLREYENRLSRTGFESDIDEEFETMKLKQKELFIEKKHQELDLKEEKYIKELDQLSQNESSLCQILTETPMNIITDETLVKRIERLRNFINKLENTKNERFITIKSYRTRLIDLINRLDFKIDNLSIVSQLMDEQYESCLRTDALSQIKSFLNELESKSAEQEKYVSTLVGKLEKLYGKLAADDASSPKRSAAYILRHNTTETVKQLEHEISQLQAKRMATSQVYCQNMQRKIQELYEQCQLGNSERHPIDFDNITPETLDECDKEYDRLDNMYHSRKPILDTFTQWQVLVQQRNEFQKKSSSATRFHERGYSAVKEQAERKRFIFVLPKAERACLNVLEQWEKEHSNEQFLINDIPIRQIIKEYNASAASNMATTTTINNPSTIISKTISTSSTTLSAVPQRTVSKTNIRKKSLRNIVKPTVEPQVVKSRHDTANDNTLEFTQFENIKHFNGLARIVTSTPKSGKNARSHTVVDLGRNKINDPIQKRRQSKRLIPTRR